MTKLLQVNEVFYSLQGEGARTGEPSVFVRLRGCSAKHACYASGVRCDTEFESGGEMTADVLHEVMLNALVPGNLPNKSTVVYRPWVVWTGGEPLDQLTPEHVLAMRERGWLRHAIETSGVREMSAEMSNVLDYVAVSPKVAEHVLKKNFGHLRRADDTLPGPAPNVDELRYVRGVGQAVPEPALVAFEYCLSPHSDGDVINPANLAHVIRLCEANPRWRLSLQQHKVWGVR